MCPRQSADKRIVCRRCAVRPHSSTRGFTRDTFTSRNSDSANLCHRAVTIIWLLLDRRCEPVYFGCAFRCLTEIAKNRLVKGGRAFAKRAAAFHYSPQTFYRRQLSTTFEYRIA